MSIYLLVHGGWVGGWVWDRVARPIRKAGHEVYTPTLTGLGDRSNLAHPEIDVNTHIEDVLEVLESQDLSRVVLVGHDYGGVVITGVANRASNRLGHLFYLDAFVPQAGQSLADLVGHDASSSFEERARVEGDGWRVPPPPPSWFGQTDDTDFRWLQPKLTAQPLKTVFQPLSGQNPEAVSLPRTYVHCNEPAMALLDQSANRARAEGWRYQKMSTGHFPNITAPHQVADLLLELEQRGYKQGML